MDGNKNVNEISPLKSNNPILSQKGIVLWLFGLSGAGKSTLACLLEKKLTDDGRFTIMLDGDDLRKGINKDLTFSETDRKENIRRVAEIASILAQRDVIVICSFITPLKEYRRLARKIIGAYYYEVFVDCPLHICELRDVKGLYKKAKEQKLENFTGISSPFEASEEADFIIPTSEHSPSQSAEALYQKIAGLIER